MANSLHQWFTDMEMEYFTVRNPTRHVNRSENRHPVHGTISGG